MNKKERFEFKNRSRLKIKLHFYLNCIVFFISVKGEQRKATGICCDVIDSETLNDDKQMKVVKTYLMRKLKNEEMVAFQ